MYKIKIHTDCDGCGECVDVCPSGVIKIENGVAIVVDESEDCQGCESCMETCPKDNITIEEI